MKIKIKSLLLGGLLLTSLLNVSVVGATEEKQKDEGWNIPNVALGNGLTDTEIEQTLDALKVKGSEKYNLYTVTGTDLMKYVTDIDSFTKDSKSFSSVYMVRTDDNTGVNVTIETPDNITARTEAMYRNASITSGVTNAEIRIASVRVMDGSGALAGIYKIYDEVEPAKTKEEALERLQSRKVAQKEMSVISEISKDNSDKKGFSDDNLAVALADIKSELQDMNSKLQKMADDKKKETIRNVVDKEIKKQGLEDVISKEQEDKIVDLMISFSESPSINNTELKSQLADLKSDIEKNGKDFIETAKNKVNSEETKNFFQKIMESISNFFSNLFG